MATWNIRLIAGFTAILALLTLSCSMDLEPAKAGTASVSLTVGSPAGSALSRAVAPGLGYLYIRTIGGPTGAKGPFYGPFPLESGATFTTKDIPAGTYAGIGVLYATKELDGLTAVWDGGTRTFAELMGLSDEEFALFTEGPEGSDEPSAMERLLDGYASAELMENVTIKQNQKNQLSLTLVPACGDSGIAMSGNPELNVYTEEGDPDRLIRKYVRLDGVFAPTGYTLNNLTCTIDAAGGIYVGSIALYDEDGILIGQREQVNSAISADMSLSRPWNGDDTFYLYVEYRGSALSLAFSSDMEGGEQPPVEPPPVEPSPNEVVLEVVAGSAHAGRKFIAGIYPYVGPEKPEGEPVAVMVLVLNEYGNGSASFVDASTGAVHSFGSGTWTITGFIDVNANYPDIMSGANLVSSVGVEPHYGDYTCEVMATTDGTASMSRGITSSDFIVSDTYVYYVSQGGAGTRNGQRTANAMSVNDFTSLLAAGSARVIRAYALEGLSFTEATMWTVANGDQLALSSLEATQISTLMIDFDGRFNIQAGSTLHLSDITIDGGTTEYNNQLVFVYGTLILADGARLQNRTNVEGAGGVQVVEGGLFAMEEGSFISNCVSQYNRGGAVQLSSETPATPAVFNMNGGTITGCSANNGGAIAVTSASSAILGGGTIEECVADQYGGAVYVYGDMSFESSLTLSGTEIRGCSANEGGAVYAEVYAEISMTNGIIDDCTASLIGGGFSIRADTGLPVTLGISGGTLSNCSATDNGGGVSAIGMYASVTMTGGTIDNCNAPSGGAFYLSSSQLYFTDAGYPFITNTTANTDIDGWAILYEGGASLSPNPNPDPSVMSPFINPFNGFAVYQPV